MERRWRVGIRVTTVHVIDLRSDVLLCITPFYVLFVYFYLCYAELTNRTFSWSSRDRKGIYYE